MADNHTQSDWQQCRPGDLSRVASSVRARHNRRQALAAFGKAAVAVSLIVVAVVGVQAIQRQPAGGDMYYGGISCTDVRKQAADYMAERLAPDVAQKIETHLAQCAMCRELVEKMQRKQMDAAPSDGGGAESARVWRDGRLVADASN